MYRNKPSYFNLRLSKHCIIEYINIPIKKYIVNKLKSITLKQFNTLHNENKRELFALFLSLKRGV